MDIWFIFHGFVGFQGVCEPFQDLPQQLSGSTVDRPPFPPPVEDPRNKNFHGQR